MMILAPSMLSADFKELGKEIRTIEENGAQYLHFDVMDGIFVPSISFGIPVLESIRPATNLVYDAHLMITEPIRYVEAFAKGDNCFYDCFYDRFIYNIEFVINRMFDVHILTSVYGRYDWISSCVDGNIFSLKTRYGEESSIYSYDDKKESSYREYEELSIINVMTGEEKSIKAYIACLS